MDDMTGRTLRGYVLRERIGTGGFGAVYRAFQKAVGREVAIKVILPAYANQPDFIRLFETEAQLVARLEHPFIVPLFDFWRDPDGAYLVLRLFRGGTLREAMQRERLPQDSAVQVIDQIAGALAVAHRAGVIHRDLKPENILLDDDGNAYLTDFGIAKVQARDGDDDGTEDGLAGSPGYMSPEQITLEPVTPRTDVYSMGIVAFELLTGAHPFPNLSTTELIMKQLREPLPPLLAANLPDEANEVIQRATAKDPQDRFPDALALAQALRAALRPETYMADALPEEALYNPYKGLRAFEEADAADFFGREALVAQLTQRLGEDHPYRRFLAVVGPSGSGKSSVVKAGLVPSLRWGDLPGSEHWLMATMVPGTAPMDELEAALTSVAIFSPKNLRATLNSGSRGLIEGVELLLPSGAQMVLVIDQFEEVFTLLPSESERQHFLDLVQTAATDPHSPLRVIITLRADFYDRPLYYEGFGALMRVRTEVVLPMSPAELERAITGPAERAGLVVQGDLLAALVSEVREEPGALPLLQYVLTELYDRRDGNRLTLAGYTASGGVLGALARRADELYSTLSAEQQALARQLFLRLVTLGEGTEDTRRRVLWYELTSAVGTSALLQPVLDHFGKYRLLSFDFDPQTREPTVEVAHEALIRQWGKLREWLDASREDVRLERSLGDGAQEWAAAGFDASFLLRGTRLAQLEEWAGRTDLSLSDSERGYLRASIEQRQMQEKREAERRAHELELERQAANRLRILVGVLLLGFLVAAALSAFALVQTSEANLQRDVASTAVAEANGQRMIAEREADTARSLALAANAEQLSVSGSGDTALALALEANRVSDPPAQAQIPLARIAYSPGAVERLSMSQTPTGVTFSPDGRWFASAGIDGAVILWNAQTRERVWTMQQHQLPVSGLAFSPDSTRLVTGSWDRTLIIWNVADGAVVQRLGEGGTGHTQNITAVVVASDRIYSGGGDGLIVWELESGRMDSRDTEVENITALAVRGDLIALGTSSGEIVLRGALPAPAEATLPDGTRAQIDVQLPPRLTTLEPGQVAQVRVAQARAQGTLPTLDGHTSSVSSLAFTRSGLGLVSAARDSLMRWDLVSGSGQAITALDGHQLPVNSVAISADGRSMLTASEDQTVILWDFPTLRVTHRFSGHGAPVVSAAFSPDGRAGLTAADDNVLIVWNTGDSSLARRYGTQTGAVTAAALAGERVFSAGEDGTLHDWAGALALAGDPVTAAALSPDGAQALVGHPDGSASLWDLEAGEVIRTLEGHSAPVTAIVFASPTQAVTASEDNAIILWDVTDGEQVRSFSGHDRRVLALAVRGSLLVSGGGDRLVLVWDLETGERLHSLAGHNRRVLSVAISPDGLRAVSGADDGELIQWDLESGTLRDRFPLSAQAANVVTYAPDDEHRYRVVAGFEDGQLLMLMLDGGRGDYGQVVRRLRAQGAVTALGFSPDGTQVLAGQRDGAVNLWHMPTLGGLMAWTQSNRYVPELTCEAWQTFGVTRAGCP